MTLHDTVETVKKAGVGSVIGIIGIVFIVILVRVGIMVKNYYFPPKVDPPTRAYGLLPPIHFPPNTANNNFTYTIQTTTGQLPTDLPGRLSIFPIVQSQPNFLNLEKVKKKVGDLGFTVPGEQTVLKEIQLNDPFYEWDEQAGFNRKIIFNINSFDFKMTSDYLTSLAAVSGKHISDEPSALATVQDFLETAALTPGDIDLTKTSTRNSSVNYYTYPQLYSIQPGPQGNALVGTTSLSKAQVIRVDLYQKDIEYDLNTGDAEGLHPTLHQKIPVIYPNPPNSTMEFWVTSDPVKASVAQAYFTHQNINLKDPSATYTVKKPDAAYQELTSGKAYIAAYNGTDGNILIKNVYFAYYLGEESQAYLVPVYVFEGNNGFFAYVSALTEDQIQK